MKILDRSIYILLVFTVSLFGCNEHPLRKRSLPTPSSAKAGLSKDGSVTNPIDVACLSDLKKKALENKILFFNEPKSKIDDELVEQANQNLGTFKPVDENFSLGRNQRTNQIMKMGVTSWTKLQEGAPWQSYSVDLWPNDKTAKARYSVGLDYASVDAQSRPIFLIHQEVSVNEQCQLDFRTTEVTQFKYSDSGNVKVSLSDFYPDTGDKTDVTEGQLKEGEVFIYPAPIITKDSIHRLSQPHVKVFGSKDSLFAQVKILKETENQLFKNDLSHQEARGTEIVFASYMDDKKITELTLQDASPPGFEIWDW